MHIVIPRQGYTTWTWLLQSKGSLVLAVVLHYSQWPWTGAQMRGAGGRATPGIWRRAGNGYQVTHWALDPWPMWPMTHGSPGPSPHTSASLTQISRNAFLKLLAGFIFDFEFYCKLLCKLDNVAINDVGLLPLKAARRDAIANLKCFWGLGHQRPNFDGYIYIQYAAPPYLARISAIYLLPFGKVWLALSECEIGLSGHVPSILWCGTESYQSY